MVGRECYHCKQWVEEGVTHDCWTTTEEALTRDLPEDLREAWERLRETAASFGDQRIYASHKSIMFSRKSCYFFVRPKRSFLEVRVSWPDVEGSSATTHRSGLEIQGGEHLTSRTATRWRHPSPNGFGKPTRRLTCSPVMSK